MRGQGERRRYIHRCRHAGTSAVAVAAIEVEPSRRALVCRRMAFVGSGLDGVQVLVMTQMLGMLAGFMPTIRRHSRPAELERQQGEHEDREPTAHDSSLAVTEFREGSWG